MELSLCKRTDCLLEAADDETLRLLQRMPPGKRVILSYVEKRNYKNLQRWQMFVKHSFDMQDSYDTLRIWKGVLCIAAGHCDTVIDKNGNVQYFPQRVSYKECDNEDKFRQIFADAVAWFLRKHSKGMTDAEFMRVLDYE